MIKKILLIVGFLFFGLQADQSSEYKIFVQNQTPYRMNFQYNYRNEIPGCGGGGGILYEIEPNGFSSFSCGICNNTHLSSIQVFINTGIGMQQVINQEILGEDPVALSVYMATDQNGRNSFHLKTDACLT